MYTLNGQPISIDNPYTAPDGTRYPNLRDPAIRAALGVVEVADEATYDQRFYWGVGNPKDLNSLKSQWTAQVKDTAGKMLAQTDWYVTRAFERQVAIPPTVSNFRAAIIDESNRLESLISACQTVEELINVVNNQGWPQGD